MSILKDAADAFRPPVFVPLAPSPMVALGAFFATRAHRSGADKEHKAELAIALRQDTLARLSRAALRFGLSEPDIANEAVRDGHLRLLAEARTRDDASSARAVLRAYLRTFAPDDVVTRALANGVDALIPRLSPRVAGAIRTFELHRPAQALMRVSDALAATSADALDELLMLRPAVPRSRLGACAAAGTIEALAGQPDAIERVLGRVRDPEGRLAAPLTEFLYPALVRPYFDQPPSEPIKQRVIGWIREAYGDPRLPTTSRPTLAESHLVEPCVTTVRRWLAIETLHLFIEVINKTADMQWESRRDFWLPYFQENYVTDVHVAFGTEGRKQADAIRRQKNKHMRWAELRGAQSNQSVLLMRIGKLTVAEWSHAGKMRFWPQTDRAAPDLRRNEFSGPDLRDGSMTIHDEFGKPYDGVRHDPNQLWCGRAARIILENTGLKP